LSYFTKRSARIVAGSLAGALALSVTPMLGFSGIAGAADALPPLADPIGAGKVCENGPTTEPFTDVADNDPSHDEIACLVGTGLTTGVTATTYEPNASITRRQMALFIKRLIDKANELETGDLTALPAYDGVPDYLDITGESAAVKEAIGQLSQAGIVQGTTATTYSPAAPVSRRQMAAFINRTEEFLTGTAFSTTGDFFNDDNGDTGEDNLNALASVGIFQGDGAGNVFPGANLTRRQMANILTRYLQVLFSDGDIEGAFAPATNADFTPDRTGVIETAVPADGNVPGTFVAFSGLGTPAAGTVEVSLVPVAVNDMDPFVTDNGGTFSFLDEDQDGIADGTQAIDDERSSHGYSHSNPDIYTTSVNGVACSGDQVCEDASANAGAINVRLDFDSDPSDSAWVLAWVDVDNDHVLDLDANNQPTEPFGITGPLFTNAGEAAIGDCPDDDIYYVDKTANRIWMMDNDGTYIQYGNAGDTYSYDDYISLTAAQFESYLSTGDNVYFPNLCYTPGGPNEFALSDYQANMPTGVTTAVGDFDTNPADTAANDVKITWTAGTDGFVDEYDVYRDGGYIATVNNATEYVDVNVAPGTYQYRVESITHDNYGSSSLTDNKAATVTAPPPGPVAGAPISVSAVHTDGNSNDIVDNGDQLVAIFNEPIDAPSAGDSVTIGENGAVALTDTVGQLINGTNATFTKLNANTLVITVGPAGVLIGQAGSNGVINYSQAPTVVASSGNTDLDEHLEWNLAGSTDKTY
jgi:hypothetical protein